MLRWTPCFVECRVWGRGRPAGWANTRVGEDLANALGGVARLQWELGTFKVPVKLRNESATVGRPGCSSCRRATGRPVFGGTHPPSGAVLLSPCVTVRTPSLDPTEKRDRLFLRRRARIGTRKALEWQSLRLSRIVQMQSLFFRILPAFLWCQSWKLITFLKVHSWKSPYVTFFFPRHV